MDGVLCLWVLECQVALLELVLTRFWTAGAGEPDGGQVMGAEKVGSRARCTTHHFPAFPDVLCAGDPAAAWPTVDPVPLRSYKVPAIKAVANPAGLCTAAGAPCSEALREDAFQLLLLLPHTC